MELGDLTKPGEKKKLIWAGALGLVAIVFLWWTFFGFGSGSKPTPPRTTPAQGGLRSQPTPRGNQTANNQTDTTQELSQLVSTLRGVNVLAPNTNVPDARRNIFAFYEPPAPVKVDTVPPQTPTPTPPVLLASVSPANVYAGTGEFPLEVTGDKFTSDVKIFVDGQELQTQYRSAQQLSAKVPSSLIANPGVRAIAVRSTDGRVYSNSLTLNIAQPPKPNYTYIGLISTKTHVDIALLQDLSSKTLVNAQRGEMFGGRFRLTSIADKEVVFTDTTLKLTHRIKMTEGEKGIGSPLSRPTPRVDAEDDEPEN